MSVDRILSLYGHEDGWGTGYFKHRITRQVSLTMVIWHVSENLMSVEIPIEISVFPLCL